jgi:hypothetical protein
MAAKVVVAFGQENQRLIRSGMIDTAAHLKLWDGTDVTIHVAFRDESKQVAERLILYAHHTEYFLSNWDPEVADTMDTILNVAAALAGISISKLAFFHDRSLINRTKGNVTGIIKPTSFISQVIYLNQLEVEHGIKVQWETFPFRGWASSLGAGTEEDFWDIFWRAYAKTCPEPRDRLPTVEESVAIKAIVGAPRKNGLPVRKLLPHIAELEGFITATGHMRKRCLVHEIPESKGGLPRSFNIHLFQPGQHVDYIPEDIGIAAATLRLMSGGMARALIDSKRGTQQMTNACDQGTSEE